MLALSVGTSTKVFATNDKISEYEKKLNSINIILIIKRKKGYNYDIPTNRYL